MSLTNVARVFDLDLREYIEKLWDESIPIVRHAIIEAAGVDKINIEGAQLLLNIEDLCKKLHYHIVNKFQHKFEPQGASIVFILKESHLAIHTWPEKGYVHLDLVTCSKDDLQSVVLINEFVKIFSPKSTRVIKLKY